MSLPERPNLFALLIGIDRYSQTPLPGGGRYPHLGGCVRDINHVEQMLRARLSLTDEQITKLVSANSNNGQPADDAATLPTYENLVKAFKDLTAKAQSGDQVYIHYSGHGGRSATMFEELKGANGLDESLVPCDIGENANGDEKSVRYLRDIEIAYLLKAMSDKGLLVTLVLDSCHSGGATRGSGGAVTRGITSIDTRKPPEQSSVADKQVLIESFREMPSSATRSVNAASGWRLPTPKNCVIISACRANELANEYAFDGSERNGALTYWMLDALKQIGEGYTYKMLYNRVVAKVHAKFVDQTPQLEGDSDREIFGGGKLATSAAVNVLKVDSPNKSIQLNAGQAQGIGKGAQFAVYAANATDFADLSQRLAVVEIENAGATESDARIVTDNRAGEIREGSQAVLLGVGIRLRGRVRLVKQKNVFDEAAQDAAIEKLRAVIAADEGDTAAGEKWIRLANDGEEVDFQVAVNVHGEYEIWDANGRTLPNLRPAQNISDDGAPAQIAKRLVHLTKYRNARLIDNTDPTSPLARKIVAELGRQKKDKEGNIIQDEKGNPVFEAFGTPARPLSVGEEVCLRVTNLSGKPVNIAIMDLQPDWGISQAFPSPDGGQEYELLEAGADKSLLLPMQAWLPEDYQEGVDTLKIFATIEGTSFHWLEMPALDQPPAAIKRSVATDALEQLMTAFA
ncbi:MAG TPA: caspase family protein, partial [Pyrinomonadaceae bacterium]